MKTLASLLTETLRQFLAHKVPRMGAALSFYTVLSLAPLVVLMLSLVSLSVGRHQASTEMVGQVRAQIGNEGADMVATILAKTANAHPSPWEAAIGFVVLLVGASGVFGELQDSLNQIWDVIPRRHPVLALLKERLISFAMVFVVSLLMLLSFLFSAVIAVAGDYLHGLSPRLDSAWELGNSGGSLLVIALLFALIFRLVPDTPVRWRDVWPGALLAAGLFVLGKLVLGFYFGRSAIASSYGAAGPIIILAWVFYSAQIFFFGAEFTRVYALRHRSQRIHQGPRSAP